MYRGKNKFEVMYTREQVNYEAGNIIELLISHIIYIYWSYFSKTNLISSQYIQCTETKKTEIYTTSH
jgi:hypothetical protein